MLRASTARARELIDGVLEYARGGELQTEQVALGALVTEVGEDLRARLEQTGATLTAGELPVLEADRAQLRRVFQNLVSNGLKFRADAAPRIQVSAQRAQADWVISVRDNGIGVPTDQAVRIFGMFARAGGSSEGAGIGLAVCRRVVEAHGGRIWVEAADGGGSAFRFSLPQAK
jgi:two-component system, chemotaxis family, sensor kinase Cph1